MATPNESTRSTWCLEETPDGWRLAGTTHALAAGPAEFAPGHLGAQKWANAIMQEAGMPKAPLWIERRDDRGRFLVPSATPDDFRSTRAARLRNRLTPQVSVTLDDDQFKELLRNGQIAVRAVDTASRMVAITISWTV